MGVTNKNLQTKINNRIETEYRDDELEQQLTAYILRVAPTMALDVEWFSNVIFQEVLQVVQDLRLVMTDKSLMRELKQRNLISKDDKALYQEMIIDLFDVEVTGITNKTAVHLSQQILELYESRRILGAVGTVVSDIKNFNLKETKKILLDLGRPVGLADNTKEGYYLDDYQERKDALIEKRERIDETAEGTAGIPTGIALFDNKIGGVMKKEFGVIAGIPGVGKTAGILSFGLHAFKLGYNVLIVSGEMDKLAIQYRLDSNLAGIDGNKFRKAELSEEDHKNWESTIGRYNTMHDNYIYVKAYPRKFTFADVEQTILKIQEATGKPLDWLGADYLNIIDPIQGVKNGSRMDWNQQAEVVWDFKALVEEYNLVGWTGNQVKDQAFAKELYDLSDLKYGRAIPEACPIVVAMIRTEKDELAKRMKLQIMKMRNAPGIPKPISLTPNMSLMRLNNQMLGAKKSLADLKQGYIDIVPETVKTRPVRSLKK